MQAVLVQADGEYEGLIRYLLGRVVVADTIDHAISIARKYHYSLRIVTLEGELLNAGGSMTGGAFKNTSNLLGRRSEIEELENCLQRLFKTDRRHPAGIKPSGSRRLPKKRKRQTDLEKRSRNWHYRKIPSA